MTEGSLIKKAMEYNFYCNLVIYICFYMVKSFVIWKFTNPFRWIVDIPTYSRLERFGILFFVVAYQFGQFITIKEKLKKTK